MPFLISKGVDNKSFDFFDKDFDKETLLEKLYMLISKPSENASLKLNSVIVGVERAEDIIIFYKENKPAGATQFTVSKENIEKFQNKFSYVPSKADYGLGINVYLKKKSASSGIFILLEPVYYKIPRNGHVINHLKDEAVTDQYTFLLVVETGSVISEKNNCDAELAKYPLNDSLDHSPVQRAFMPLNILDEFTQHLENGANQYRRMHFRLARNAKQGRITFILSCNDGNVDDPILSAVTQDDTRYWGYYLDQHDLIPPPPDEM